MGVKKEVAEKLSLLATGAFGLVAALAWNEAVKSLFAEGGPLAFASVGGVWFYAVIVTIIAVFATIWIGRAAAKVN